MDNRILLVRIPAEEVKNGRELRDYILESLRTGVLVLTDDTTCEVMEFPTLSGVEISKKEQSLLLAPEPAEAGKPGLMGPRAGEKRVIMERMQTYRKKHGLGCWTAVSEASGGQLSDDQLRDMCAGTGVLPISVWRLANNLLDKLCKEESVNDETV